MRHLQTTIDAIKQRYWPRIGPEGKLLDANDDGSYEDTGRFDPNVVWAGPFIDGLVHLGIFGGRNVKDARHNAKVFFYERMDKGPEQFGLVFERAIDLGKGRWPFSQAKYGPPLDLRSISGRSGQSVEPGDIKNSPSIKVEAESIWESKPEQAAWVPEILVDKKFGLHILRRGDKLTKTWTGRVNGKRQTITEVFVLREPSEGSSLVPARKGDSELITV